MLKFAAINNPSGKQKPEVKLAPNSKLLISFWSPVPNFTDCVKEFPGESYFHSPEIPKAIEGAGANKEVAGIAVCII